ncbi:MAG: hypothetical protein AYL32_009650 [Candidatus Bathyarchaeota archaeon B26-2]|nr:MAG: hypothetical protein AYL32_009650 [Candidatus Bathyarchaeota archaeon B26-2]
MSYSEFKLLFGDIHGHSNYSLCGVCRGRDLRGVDCYVHTSVISDYSKAERPEESVDLFYYRAKNELDLDFAALTDHDFSMSDEMWNFLKERTSEWYSPGKFTTLQAYEWTSLAYGHRNVYFLEDDPPLFRCVDYGSRPSFERGMTPRDLWRNLEKAEVEAITIPHHPSLTQFPVDWNFFNEKFDRLVEIVSIWGVFEHYGNPFQCITSDNIARFFAVDALERGYKLGFIGGGDTHDCFPGSKFRALMKKNVWGKMMVNSLSTGYTRYFLHNPLGAGVAGVYATENTRESIFEALHSKRAYAVVGAKIRLRFALNGRLMGGELTLDDPSEPIEVRADAEGEGRIDTLEIVKNGRAVHRVYGTSNTVSTKFIDEEEPRRLYNYYYVRVVQRDGARAWSSPIWVSYKELGEVKPETFRSGLLLHNRGRIDFKRVKVAFFKTHPLAKTDGPDVIKTRGRGFFLWIEKANGLYDLVLRLRFKSSGRPSNFRGFLKLRGVEEYRVDPVGFASLKYGGDLFRDNYRGMVEWDITPSSRLNRLDVHDVKGLDFHVRLTLMEDAYAVVDTFVDGERPLGEAFLGSRLVEDFPFKVHLCRVSEGRVLEVGTLRAGGRRTLTSPEDGWRFLAVYPAAVDEMGFRWRLEERGNM